MKQYILLLVLMVMGAGMTVHAEYGAQNETYIED